MPTQIDHVVILVEDLDQAIAQYGRLGFNVVHGGRHPRFTHNAIIPFQDGSYIELIAFYEHPNADRAESHRWYKYLKTGGGIVDYALLEPNLDALVADADTRDFTHEGPTSGARTRPDNVEIAWKTATPAGGENVGALPFLITDVTERELRVPVDQAIHDNRTSSIESLVVAVRNLDAATARYCKLLGREEPSGKGLKNLNDADGVYFMLGGQRIDVATPTGPGALQAHLERRGDSPFELVLQGPETRDIPPEDAAGARIRIAAA